MRLFGFVLLIVGFLLCVSIAWAALGFLMMGFGLICLLIAERNRKPALKPDVSDPAAGPFVDAIPAPAKPVDRQKSQKSQKSKVFLEPTFAATSPGAPIGTQTGMSDLPALEDDGSPPVGSAHAPSRVENVGDRRTPPPLRATRSSEFDRIRALRAERGAVRNEPEFRDFSIPVEREPRERPLPPPLPAQSVSAAAAVPPPITAAPPIIAESKAVAKQPLSETAPAEPTPVKAERSVLFDDAEDLADLFNKFDLGKD